MRISVEVNEFLGVLSWGGWRYCMRVHINVSDVIFDVYTPFQNAQIENVDTDVPQLTYAWQSSYVINS